MPKHDLCMYKPCMGVDASVTHVSTHGGTHTHAMCAHTSVYTCVCVHKRVTDVDRAHSLQLAPSRAAQWGCSVKSRPPGRQEASCRCDPATWKPLAWPPCLQGPSP